MKSFIAKQVISIWVNFRYLRFKFLKYKENNKKICDPFGHDSQIYTFMYNELGINRKVLFCILLPLLYKCQKWCLTRFVM